MCGFISFMRRREVLAASSGLVIGTAGCVGIDLDHLDDGTGNSETDLVVIEDVTIEETSHENLQADVEIIDSEETANSPAKLVLTWEHTGDEELNILDYRDFWFTRSVADHRRAMLVSYHDTQSLLEFDQCWGNGWEASGGDADDQDYGSVSPNTIESEELALLARDDECITEDVFTFSERSSQWTQLEERDSYESMITVELE